MQRFQQEKAYILHRRPYKGSGLLLDVFSREHGRLSLIAQSARGPRSRFRGLIEPFSEMEINFSGRHELKFLQQLELVGRRRHLQARKLLCGLHVNELLVRLLGQGVAFQKLYDDYDKFLDYLTGHEMAACLRVLCYFELRLLTYLGYELPLSQTHDSECIIAEHYYRFDRQMGFIACSSKTSMRDDVFYGADLIALREYRLQNEKQRLQAKRFLSHVFKHYLLGKKLHAQTLLDA